MKHVNICEDEVTVPEYAFHSDKKVCGFFGLFRFLSNFFPSEVCYEELIYPSVENAYQAAKYPKSQRGVFTSCTAKQAKKLGREAPDLDVKKWNKKKYDIMMALVLQKFIRNKELKEMLLATDDAYLEETNSWGDSYWGCNESGEGENNLGKILMNVRDHIRKNKL